MISNQKKKTVVKQEDLRRLMKQQTNSDKKRIDSPLAKYNNIGQLICIVCNTIVKNELLWNAHLLSRTHKENLAKDQQSGPSHVTASLKRKATDTDSHIEKQRKLAIPTPSTSSVSSNGLPAEFFDPAFQESNGSIVQPSTSHPRATTKQTEVKVIPLAADYQSSDEEDSEEEIMASTSNLADKPDAVIQELPEGFFDDPKLDAKIRNIPFVDKMEEQLELFQKAIKEEATVSEALLEEDDDRRDEQRNIDEIDDQLDRWTRINNLAKQKQLIVQDMNRSKRTEDDDDGDSDIDIDTLCDWRNKMV